MRALTTLREGLQIASETLWANRLRAGLTILGVTIGVAVVVTMAALITGIRTSVTEAFEAAGPNNFMVMPFDFTDVRIVNSGNNRPPWWDRPEITVEEVERISDLASVREAIIDFDFNATMSYQGNEVTGIQSGGNSAGWPAYTLGDFVAGRNFIPQEVQQSRAVVVISVGLAEELFGQLDPIGKRIRVRGNRGVTEPFEVVGVHDAEENVFSDAVQHYAIFPWSSAEKRLNARTRFNFLGVLVVPVDEVSQGIVMDDVIGALRAMRGLGPRDENDFAVIRSDQLLDFFNQLTGVFFLVMLALSSVGMLVGGVGVIGIMMISVTERTREIGIRKAVGATRREILWQFLVESALLTLVGGALGMLLGGLAAEAVQSATPIPAAIPLWSVFAALGTAVLTGVLFGIFPAYRASRLDPVVALRYE